jgi:hypothetical protein
MRLAYYLVVGLILISCSDGPTSPAKSGPKLVVNVESITVRTQRVDFGFTYYFEGASGTWNDFFMKVDHTVAHKSGVSSSPYPEYEVQLISSWFPLTRPLSPGDTVWVSYQFLGYYFHGADTIGSFEKIDSVRRIVKPGS